jgi:hypothetical protein
MWLIIWHECFMEGKYFMSVSMQLNAFHAAKLSVWLNYMKYRFTKEKYESLKAYNTWECFQLFKSFTKIFGQKNKSEYISGFCLNLSAVLIWSNMSDTIRLHW